MSWRLAALVVATGLLTAACHGSKSAPPSNADSTASATASAAGTASASPTSAAGAQAIARWSGTYTCEPASIYVPDGKEWSGVKWRGDDAGDGIGQGTLTLRIDPASRRVEGTLDGVIGEAIVEGRFEDGALAASVERKAASDRGFTGTLIGTVPADKPETMSGTMRLSLGDGRLIREGRFTATRSAP
jgi:hypothetical protein